MKGGGTEIELFKRRKKKDTEEIRLNEWQSVNQKDKKIGGKKGLQ